MGWEREKPPGSPAPALPTPPLPEVPAVVRVRVTVFCDNHSVGELATRQALHGFLAVKHRGELHEDLRNKRQVVKTRQLPQPQGEAGSLTTTSSIYPSPELLGVGRKEFWEHYPNILQNPRIKEQESMEQSCAEAWRVRKYGIWLESHSGWVSSGGRGRGLRLLVLSSHQVGPKPPLSPDNR